MLQRQIRLWWACVATAQKTDCERVAVACACTRLEHFGRAHKFSAWGWSLRGGTWEFSHIPRRRAHTSSLLFAAQLTRMIHQISTWPREKWVQRHREHGSEGASPPCYLYLSATGWLTGGASYPAHGCTLEEMGRPPSRPPAQPQATFSSDTTLSFGADKRPCEKVFSQPHRSKCSLHSPFLSFEWHFIRKNAVVRIWKDAREVKGCVECIFFPRLR